LAPVAPALARSTPKSFGCAGDHVWGNGLMADVVLARAHSVGLGWVKQPRRLSLDKQAKYYVPLDDGLDDELVIGHDTVQRQALV